MKFLSFVRMFGKRWLRGSPARGRGNPRTTSRRLGVDRLGVETLEERTLMAVLPTPVVTQRFDLSFPNGVNVGVPELTQLNANNGNESAPALAISPTDPRKMVAFFTRYDATLGQEPRGFVQGRYSSDGGASWVQFFSDSKLSNPNTTNPVLPYDRSTNAAVAMDRNNNVYLTYLQHDVSGVASGALLLQKFNFSGGVPTPVDLNPGSFRTDKVLYQWASSIDPVFNPTITVDNTLDTFSDTNHLGQLVTQSNPTAGLGTVYVAWNTNNNTPTNTTNFNPNIVRMIASTNGGFGFSTPLIVNGPASDSFISGNFATDSRFASPSLTVSQGTVTAAGGTERVSGGQLNVVWHNYGNNEQSIRFDRIRDQIIGIEQTRDHAVFPIPGLIIGDAIDGDPVDTVRTTPSTNVVTLPTVPGGNAANARVTDIDVSLSLRHGALNELSIVLVSPGGERVVLMNNRTSPNSNVQDNPNAGTSGANFGSTASGIFLETTFDDQAARSINDNVNGAAAPFIGHYRTVGGGLLSDFLTFTPPPPGVTRPLTGADVAGTWTLEINDNRNGSFDADTPPLLFNWTLNITLSLGNDGDARPGLNSDVSVTPFATTAAPDAGAASGGFTAPYTNQPAPVPGLGIAAKPVIVSDNTLGAFSPYQGRLYAVYTTGLTGDNTNIFVRTSDDGGQSWSARVQVHGDIAARDGFSQGSTRTGKTQFQPAAAVDQSTGTLVVTYYDTRYDGAGARVARMLATSIDGGATFYEGLTADSQFLSSETFLNRPELAFDALTQTTVNMGPIPDNQSAGNANRDAVYSFGDRQAVVVANGIVTALWSGNENGGHRGVNLLDILGAQARIGTGPRILSGTMGPVGEPGDNLNVLREPDGRPKANRFRVTFDRPVDPATFTPADVTVVFRSPSGQTVNLPVTTVVPLDRRLFGPAQIDGATVFEITFNPQPAFDATGSFTGTYSYAVGPDISDRIRAGTTLVTGPQTVRNFTVTPNPINLPIPDVMTRTSTINVSGVPAGEVVVDVNVSLNLRHTFDGDLVLTLIGPNGVRVVLSNQNGFSGDDFGDDTTDTTFDDEATTSIIAGVAPFTGSFTPQSPLANLDRIDPNGVWTLEIADVLASDDGELLTWSLEITTAGDVVIGTDPGNQMDQDGDAVQNEPQQDRFAVPRPTNKVPFSGPYDPATLPLIVPGPHIRSSRAVNFYDAPALQVNRPVPPTGTGGNDINQFETRSQLTVSGLTGSLTDLDVILNINHQQAGDLRISLVYNPGPGEQRVVLYNPQTGVTGVNFTNTTFDDSAGTLISAAAPPYTGFFRPANPLAGFNGISPNGVWQLLVEDTVPNNTGTLINWSLKLTTTAGNTFDNLILNNAVRAVDMVFDRNMDPATITTADVLSMMGPTGAIAGPFTITANPNNNDPDPNFPRTYRINFPTQLQSGTYSIVLSSDIRAANGELLDTDLDAGLDVLFNRPSLGTAPVLFPSSNVPQTIGDPGRANVVTRSTITINDDFLIQDTDLTLNITYRNTLDLSAVLIAPFNDAFGNPVRVPLFTNIGNTGGNQANFTETVFDDGATTPIDQGGPPYTGRFIPQVPFQSLLDGQSVQGVWTLEITNRVAGVFGTLNGWSLTFRKAVSASGLGEQTGDQANVSTRVFVQDPKNDQAHNSWTPVGGAGLGPNQNSGRMSGLAIDPSDPSGNTVYVSGASGGVWKTTNFLSAGNNGPTWVPLTDLGPTFGINVGGIAVFGRNNDTRQSIVFVATGEGDTFTRGVGFLRSMDGGATWTLLDSSVNVDANGNELPINSPLRDHIFARGTTAFKVLVDPRLTPKGEVIVYAALSGTNGGIWRSFDTGKTWTRVLVGQATDIVFDPNSGPIDAVSNPTGNLQIFYAALRGQGVFISPNQGQNWNQMLGGDGFQLRRSAEVIPTTEVPVDLPNSLGQSNTPSGAKGRINLIKPELTGNRDRDIQYQGWLYALVVQTNENLDGLYMTKDFGKNWTRVRIPTIPMTDGEAIPTTDLTRPDYNPFGPLFGQGNYDVSFAIDPNNPNVVYIAGKSDGPIPTKLIRVDTTNISDAHNWTLGSDGALLAGGGIDNGTLRVNSQDSVVYINPPANPPGFFPNLGSPISNPLSARTGQLDSGIINLLRNPLNPYGASPTLYLRGTTRFTNSGGGVRWIPMDDEFGFVDIAPTGNDFHRLITIKDPITGLSRLIITGDHSIGTGVDAGGYYLTNVGTLNLRFGNRTGNLQVNQFYYGAGQPSQLAANIAGALFYGNAQDDGFPESDASILQTGQTIWNGGSNRGDAGGVATDQTGTGTVYKYLWPCCGGGNTDFFTVSTNGGFPVGRTFGLLQAGDDPENRRGQWPLLGTVNFAVNPINGDQIVISSAAGRIFATTNQGRFWSVIGNPGDLDSTQSLSQAYGAPEPNDPTNATNKFIYVGTEGGNVFVTFTGGGNTPGVNAWRNLGSPDALNNRPRSAVRSIATNPTRGSREAYVVTRNGVYHIRDSGAANFVWEDITGNLFGITHTPFNNPNLTSPVLGNLQAITADWRYVIPDNLAEINNPLTIAGPTHPVLYVAGDGGVFRSLDRGATWSLFPNVADDGAAREGGYFPVAEVTDLDLLLGNVNPTTGRGDVATSPSVLLATTYGRGSFSIRLSPFVLFPQLTVRLDPALPGPVGSDSGASPTDKITNVLQPVIDGFSEQSAFGNVVTIELLDLNSPDRPVIGTGQTDGQGRFKVPVNVGVFKADGTTDGLRRIGIRATDGAGVVGPIATFEFTLDTTPFVRPSTLELSPVAPNPAGQGGSDSGQSFTDRITSVERPVIRGGVDQAAPVTVELLDMNDPNQRVIGTGVTDANGNFSIQVNIGTYGADGRYTIGVRARNARNASNIPTLTFTLDRTAAAPPSVPDMLAASDSGTSAEDNVTNINTPAFNGTGEAQSIIELFANDVKVTQDRVNDAGRYTIAIPTSLADGEYKIKARQIDLAGNVSRFSDELTITIDTQGPNNPPPSLRLDPAYQTGPTVNGRVFTGASPQVLLGRVTPGTFVRIQDVTDPDNIILLDEFTQPTDTSDFTRQVNVGVGNHDLLIQAVDSSGNVAQATLLLNIDQDRLDSDRKYIRSVYFAELGRQGTIFEWDFWTPFLSRPDGRFFVASGIARSVEARTRLVRGWYGTYLGRTPTGNEEQGWVGLLAQGFTEELVLGAILGSQEYYNRSPITSNSLGSPASDQTYIRALYAQLLGRTATDAEVNAWIALIPTLGRGNIAAIFTSTPEFRRANVLSYYRNLLGRIQQPPEGEVMGWVALPLQLTDLRLGFLASVEFYFRSTGSLPLR